MPESRLRPVVEWTVSVLLLGGLVVAGLTHLGGAGLLTWLVGVPILIAVVVALVQFVGGAAYLMVVGLYRGIRYERQGICPDCKMPYVHRKVKLASDQMYGTGEIWQYVCPNGHVGMQHGNRRFADW